MPEGRQHLGVEVALGVEVRPPGGESFSASTVEVRLDGMTLNSPVSLPVGQEVDFRVVGLSLNLDGQASVLGCGPPGPGRRFRLDLAFPQDMSFIERERLARFLATRRRSPGHGG